MERFCTRLKSGLAERSGTAFSSTPIRPNSGEEKREGRLIMGTQSWEHNVSKIIEERILEATDHENLNVSTLFRQLLYN